MDRVLRLVQVRDEVLEAARVAEGVLADLGHVALGVGFLGVVVGVAVALVAQHDGEALVEEGHLLQPAADRLDVVGGLLEDLVVDPVRDRAAGLLRGLALAQRPGDGAGVVLAPDESVAEDLHVQSDRQRVDHRDADAVQAAGDRVGVAVELAAGVQHGEHHLHGGTLLHRVHVDRDAAAVVDHPDATVVLQRDLDAGGVAGHRLVDRVVHDLPDQVVQATLAGGSDVHAGPLAHGLQPFQHGDRRRAVGVLLLRHWLPVSSQ